MIILRNIFEEKFLGNVFENVIGKVIFFLDGFLVLVVMLLENMILIILLWNSMWLLF